MKGVRAFCPSFPDNRRAYFHSSGNRSSTPILVSHEGVAHLYKRACERAVPSGQQAADWFESSHPQHSAHSSEGSGRGAFRFSVLRSYSWQMTVTLSNAQQVAEFHRAIGKRLPAVPTVPDATDLAFRLTLLAEEVAEVQEAAGHLSPALPQATPADLIPLAHELTDLLYVTYGALLSLGINPDLTFAEIHRVNMLKTTGPRRADGKQLKPEGWRPADLRSVLAQRGPEEQPGELDETLNR